MFTPSTDVKDELKNTAIQITCLDENGNVLKRVTSGDSGEVEDPENGTTSGNENQNQIENGGGSQNQGGNQGGGGYTPPSGGGNEND